MCTYGVLVTKYVFIVHCVYWVYVCVFCTLSSVQSVNMYCLYVNCFVFCTVWSTLSRISLTKALVLWWCDNKSDLILILIWSRATTHRRIKEFGYSCRIPLVKPLLIHRQRQRRLTWAKEKKNWTVAQWSKVLFSDESKFCISLGNQGPRVWRKGGWSPVLSFHSLWWFGVQCHLLVLVHCVFWKPTSLHQFTKKFWSTSCFLLLTSFLKMLISFSSRIWHLPTLPKAPKVG